MHSERSVSSLAFVLSAAFALSVAAMVAGCDGCARGEPPAPHTKMAEVRPSPPPVPSSESSQSNAPTVSAREPDALAAKVPARGARAAHEITWTYAKTAVGPMNVVISIPATRAGERFPVLIAMHGRGEALKGPQRGARGWIDDYDLYEALARLAHPPLVARDFRGFASADRLRRMNESLVKAPYGGLVIVMPYTPDMLGGDEPFESAKPLARFLVDELLPRVYRETPAIGTPATTGIDGVSLGGRASITVGLLRPKAFAVVSSLQAAFDSGEVQQVVDHARSARAQNPKLRLELVTSDGDFFLDTNREISKALTATGISHRLLVVSGPHDYVFNRGPGAYEMLLVHDRELRGRPPP